MTLLYHKGLDKPHRLSCLMIRKNRPLSPEHPTHELDLEFYDLWNKPLWEQMVGDAETCFGALVDAGRRGEVTMSKIIRSPSGKFAKREFSLIDAIWTADMAERADDKEPWVSSGIISLPRRFTISNALAGKPVVVPNPVVELKDDEQPIDDAQ